MATSVNVKLLITSILDNNRNKTLANLKAMANGYTGKAEKDYWDSIKKRLEEIEDQKEGLLALPNNVRKFLYAENLQHTFRENRYYLSKRERQLYDKIVLARKVGHKLEEMNICYLNSVLVYGETGTGKTTFAKYVAYKLGLPFLYLNLSSCIDSHLGETSKNIDTVFRYIEDNDCVLLLDEIDAIGISRNGNNHDVQEISRVTITLMQCLDRLNNKSVLIGATNLYEELDVALVRRFNHKHEVKKLDAEESELMVCKYLDDVGFTYDKRSISKYVLNGKSQGEMIADMTQIIIKKLEEQSLNEELENE